MPVVEQTFPQVYDIKNDPQELTNLALQPKFAAQLKRHRKNLIAELRRTDAGMVDHLPAVKTASR